jgi:hypothetical protein
MRVRIQRESVSQDCKYSEALQETDRRAKSELHLHKTSPHQLVIHSSQDIESRRKRRDIKTVGT